MPANRFGADSDAANREDASMTPVRSAQRRGGRRRRNGRPDEDTGTLGNVRPCHVGAGLLRYGTAQRKRHYTGSPLRYCGH